MLIYTDRHWRRFFSAVGKAQLAEDPRFTSIEGRTRAIDELYRFVEDELRPRSTQECVALLREADIPHGPVNSIEDLFSDPHLGATHFFQSVEQPGLGAVRLPRAPIDFGAPFPVPRPAPRLGEHTREVLEQHGFTSAEVDELVAIGAARPVHATTAAMQADEAPL